MKITFRGVLRFAWMAMEAYIWMGALLCLALQDPISDHLNLGLLYLFTAGLCLIGTIVDLVKHEEIAFEYNRTVADEAFRIVKGN
jgi:hypothetical protein